MAFPQRGFTTLHLHPLLALSCGAGDVYPCSLPVVTAMSDAAGTQALRHQDVVTSAKQLLAREPCSELLWCAYRDGNTKALLLW